MRRARGETSQGGSCRRNVRLDAGVPASPGEEAHGPTPSSAPPGPGAHPSAPGTRNPGLRLLLGDAQSVPCARARDKARGPLSPPSVTRWPPCWQPQPWGRARPDGTFSQQSGCPPFPGSRGDMLSHVRASSDPGRERAPMCPPRPREAEASLSSPGSHREHGCEFCGSSVSRRGAPWCLTGP